jgi:NADH-quinone oxidoreductase subunit M
VAEEARVQHGVTDVLAVLDARMSEVYHAGYRWADGHASAPTAVSMLHAGVLMKLGGYGCFRIAMYLMPTGAAIWGDFFLVLTTISVVYGAFSAVVQTDLKYINAYSSVSHCGLVLFALLMMTRVSATGAILQMLSHGLMTA